MEYVIGIIVVAVVCFLWGRRLRRANRQIDTILAEELDTTPAQDPSSPR